MARHKKEAPSVQSEGALPESGGTIRMFRLEGEPSEADVHPLEVDSWKQFNWRIKEE